MTDGFFQGYALNAVDAKNRLSIPADFRDVIQARSGNKDLLIAPGHGGADCLLAYDRSYAAQLSAEHRERHGAGNDRARFDEAHLLFGAAQTLKIDDAGRVVLSATLKALGCIAGHVWFVAGGDWFEMWDPWAYLARPGLDPRIARIITAELATRGLTSTPPAPEPAT